MKSPTSSDILARQFDPGRVPVTLLTGFLGAGKTTLLNRLMDAPEMATAAVFINEFGEVGIDHHLVERIDDALVILDSGCLCCTVQGDLIAELKRLHDRMARREIPPVARVVIETTGLADPAPVVRALMEDRFVAARFRCEGIVTVVDTVHARDQIARHREARVQVSMADRIVLTKADLSDRAKCAALEKTLATLNPAAPRITAQTAAQQPQLLFGGGLYAAEAVPQELSIWLGQSAPTAIWSDNAPRAQTPHSGRVRSFSVTLPVPVAWRGFALRIGEILTHWKGPLLRLKGIVAVDGLQQPMAIQCVQATAYAPVRLDKWPATGPLAKRQGAVVIIGEDLSATDEAGIRALLADLPQDRPALRLAAAQPGLPTRLWLSERMPLAQRLPMSVDAFIVQPRYLANMRNPA